MFPHDQNILLRTTEKTNNEIVNRLHWSFTYPSIVVKAMYVTENCPVCKIYDKFQPCSIVSLPMTDQFQETIFNYYLAVPQPTLGHYFEPHSSHINHCVLTISTQWSPGAFNQVGSLSQAKCPVGFEPGIFWFWLQCLINPPGHSPQIASMCVCFTSFIISI